MKRISYEEVGHRYTLSPFAEPVAHVEPGESVLFVTDDASSGQIRNEGDVRDRSKVPFSNPVVGPVYIEGAEEGDTVSISVENIRPLRERGATWFYDRLDNYLTGTSLMKLTSCPVPKKTKICKIEQGRVQLLKGVTIPYRPMIGLVAVAPRPETHSLSTFASVGPHGGNMDIPYIRPGTTVFLPVFHRGALLYLGDAHAGQGDGEILGVGIEMSAEITVKVGLLKGKSIRWPRFETSDEIGVIVAAADGRDLRGALGESFIELSSWIEEEYEVERLDAFLLCGQVGKLKIGNLWTVAATIEKSVLSELNRRVTVAK